MPPLYLDVESSHAAGYRTAFDGFQWPISQAIYDYVAIAFVDFLESLAASNELQENKKIDLALSIIPIANESFSFAGSHMIIDACNRIGQTYAFARNSLYYASIHEYRTQSGQSVHESLLKMQSTKQNTFRSRRVRPLREKMRRSRLWVGSKRSKHTVYTSTTNKLMNEWASPSYVSLRSLVSNSERRLSSIGKSQISTELSTHIADNFVSILTNHGFETNELVFEYFRRIAKTHLANANIWRNKNLEKFFGTSDSLLLTATAGGFESRLISHVFQRNNLPVVRFTHGGERGLIDDPRWHYSELMFADLYLVHGHIEATQVNEAVARKTSSLTSSNLKAVGIGSIFHSRLRDTDSKSSPTDRIRNVMVVPASLTNEIRPAFASTGEEAVYLEWHLRLLKFLRDSEYNVVSKRHPKGYYASTKLFDGYAHQEITDQSFTELTRTADAFVFDFAASAFMEALCTNKPVVLIDIPMRPLLASGRRDLEKICTIVPAEYDDDNRIVVDLKKVQYGLELPVDKNQRQTFIEKYLLQPSDDLNTFTDLVEHTH